MIFMTIDQERIWLYAYDIYAYDIYAYDIYAYDIYLSIYLI